MENNITNLFLLFCPIVFGILSIVAAYSIEQKTLANNPFVDLVVAFLRVALFDHVAIPQYRGIIARGLFATLGVVLLLYPAFRDYSGFFPPRVTMEVFFDESGLVEALDQFSAADLQKLNLENDWRNKRQKYFVRLNDDLRHAGINFQFLLQRAMTVGKGEGTFKPTKIGWSSQRYKISEANGLIYFETPSIGGSDVHILQTGYDLIDTDASHINENGFSVYLPHTILVRPEFLQYVRLSPTYKTFHHILIGATYISVPFFEVQQTVYLVAGPDGGNIPIGYAIVLPAKN